MSDRGRPGLRRDNLYVPVVILIAIVVVVALKLKSIEGWPGPAIFGDELLHRLYAQRIHDWASYDLALHWIEPAYPPLYPMLISLGLYASNWYHAMLVLNILAMAAAPFLAYAITRWFAGRPAATAAAVVATVVPSGVIPMVWIVAESLAVPVFLLAVWATLGPWLYSYRRAFLAGCAVGAAYLVKYVLLSFLPPLALGFFLMQFAMAWHLRWPQRIAAVAVRCVLVALGFAIVMAAWLFYARWSGLSAINALGLWNTGFLPPKSYDGLGFYFILLTLAALLAVAPLLGLMAIYRPKNRGEWVYFAIVLVTLFWAAGFNAWICWKSNNYLMQGAPFDAGKAMHFLTQRYFLYVTWLALPIAFVAAEQVASSGPVRRVAAWLIGSLLAAAAVLILIAGWVWPAAPRLLNFNSPDIWSYLYAGQFLGHAPLSALLLAVAPASLLLFRPLWPGWRGSATAAVASVAVFGTLAVMGWRALLPEPANWAAVARNMAATLQEWGAEGDNALVVVDRNQIPDGPGYYAWTTMFWMPKPALVVAGTATTRPDGRLDVVYDWPKNRVGYWAPAKLPDTMPSAVFLFSGGPAPAGARVLGGAGWPVKSYFLAPIPAEQRRVAQ